MPAPVFTVTLSAKIVADRVPAEVEVHAADSQPFNITGDTATFTQVKQTDRYFPVLATQLIDLTEIGVPAIGPTKFLSVKASNPSFGANTVDLILDTETVILTPIGTVASFMASVKLTGATFSITAPAGTAVQIALMA